MIKVSIIVPVYNVEPYIARCVQSVIDQTYDGPMECLLVDDCGTDNSMAVAEQMVLGYKGPIDFKVLHHEHNKGLSAARNTGTDAATGDYVYYLDSDDALTTECIEDMVCEAEKHPGIEVIIGSYVYVGEDGKMQERHSSKELGYYSGNDRIRLLYFKQGYGLSGVAWNKLIKKDFILSNFLYFKERVIHEDDHWSFYLYKCLNQLSIIEACTYKHYVVQGSLMDSRSEQRTADSVFVILEDLVESIDGKYAVLQLFFCLEEYLHHVFPYLAKKKTKALHFSFFKKLLGFGYLKIAFYFVVNRRFNLKYYQLSYVMIPKAYQDESDKAIRALHK